MTAAWICQRINGEVTAHDDERAALEMADWLVTSGAARAAVVFRAEVEADEGTEGREKARTASLADAQVGSVLGEGRASAGPGELRRCCLEGNA